MDELTAPKEQNAGDDETQLVAELVEQFIDGFQSKNKSDLDEFLRPYPSIVADRVRNCLGCLHELRDMSRALDGARDRDVEANIPQQIGDFRIVREIGRGGMGVVYEAEELTLDRRVAVKILPFAAVLDKRQLQRFRNEARAAANLKHNNIVSVYSVGFEDGVHFFTMELIEGENLAEIISQLQRLQQEPSPQATEDTARFALLSTHHSGQRKSFYETVARVGVQAAEALDYAHSLGVIHRDIKPANLMFDHEGNLSVADFGLALSQANSKLTLTGDVVGTLRYMSPEQTLGSGIIDHRVDIYSLGMTLYELATLQPAYQGADRHAILQKIVASPPVAPRQLQPDIPRDLETVILKAISPNRDDRYETAALLASDLNRFLEQRPVAARRPTHVSRVWSWAKRNRTTAILATLSLLLLITVAVGGISTSIGLSSLNSQLVDEKAIQRQQIYDLAISQAQVAFESGDVSQCIKLLNNQVPKDGESDLRGFEWHYLNRLAAPLQAMPRGRHYLDLTTVAVSPRGNRIAVAGIAPRIDVFEADSSKRIAFIEFAHNAEIRRLSFSSDGKYLFSSCAKGRIKVWPVDDLADRVEGDAAVVQDLEDGDESTCFVLDSNGGRLISAGFENGKSHIKVYRIDADTTLLRPTPILMSQSDTGRVVDLCLSPQADTIAVAYEDGIVRLINIANLEEVASFKSALRQIDRLVFSPIQENLLAVSSSRQLRNGITAHIEFWRNGQSQSMMTRPNRCYAMRFSPDGKTFLLANRYRLELFGVDSDGDNVELEKLNSVVGHRLSITDIAFSTDETRVYTVSGDTTLRHWDLQQLHVSSSVTAHDVATKCFEFSNDGRFSYSGGFDSTLRKCDLRTGEVVMTAPTKLPYLWELAVSPDESMVAFAGGAFPDPKLTKGVGIWYPKTNELKYIRDFWGRLAGFSGDGKRLAFCGPNGIEIWDSTSNLFERHNVGLDGCVAWNPKNEDIFAGHDENDHIKIISLAEGELCTLLTNSEHAAPRTLVFSRCGTKLVSGLHDGELLIWKSEDWRTDPDPPKSFVGHTGRVYSVAFSPDGTRLLSGGHDFKAYLWNTSSHSPLLKWQLGTSFCVRFSRDGRMAGIGLRTLTDVGEIELLRGQ